jgi:predicted outer membrane repeat protein
MKYKYLKLLLILFTLATYKISNADNIIVSGNVSGNWDVDTVNVIGDINISQGQSLLIQPGVLVQFQGSFNFDIKGSVKAIGSSDFPIIFTAADTTGFRIDSIPDGGWNGLRLSNVHPGVDSSLFTFCQFSYGKAVNADSLNNYGGAICIRKTNKVAISHCLFENNFAFYNGGAIYLKEANILIKDCEFTGNDAGRPVVPYGYGGAVSTDKGEPVIANNTFENNTSTGIGGALAVRFKDCPVHHNIFTGNYSALGGAIGILHIPQCYHSLNNNLIVGNSCAFFGGGVSNNVASPTWINNTIAYNHSYSYGGGFYCYDSICPNVYNTILYGNNAGVGDQVYLFGTTSQANFYNCDVQGGPQQFGGSGGGAAFTGAYENNLDADPLFMMTEPYLYALQPESSCINAGTADTTGLNIPEKDLAGNTRFFNNRIDIGAYESQVITGINDGEVIFADAVLYSPSPNPACVSTNISFYLLQRCTVNIQILDLEGKPVKLFPSQILNEGMHQICWDLSDHSGRALPAGMYVCQLNCGNRSFTKKITISR